MKSCKLSWFYHNCTALTRCGIGQQDVHMKPIGLALSVLNKSDESRVIVSSQGSKNGPSSSRVMSGTRTDCPILASPAKFPLTWSMLRYYMLKYKHYVQSHQHGTLQNISESMCPCVLNVVNSETKVKSKGYEIVYRGDKMKRRHLSLTPCGYRDRQGHSSMKYDRPGASVHSSMPFHTSCHLHKSDDSTMDHGYLTNEEEFTYNEEPSLYVPENIDKNDIDVKISSGEEEKYDLDDKLVSLRHVVDHPKNKKSNKESDSKVKRTRTMKKTQKSIDTLLNDINHKNGGNQSLWGKSPVLPPGDKKPVTKRKKSSKRKDKEISECEKINDHSSSTIMNGNSEDCLKGQSQNVVESLGDKKTSTERKKKSKRKDKETLESEKGNGSKSDSKKRNSTTNSDGLSKGQSHNSNNGSEIFKMVENIPSNIQQVVRKYGVRSVTEGYTCLVTRCPKLPRPSRSKKAANSPTCGQLYINALSGHFQCDECQKSGTWTDLQLNLQHLRPLKSQSKIDYPCMSEVSGATLRKQGAEEAEIYLTEGVPLNQLNSTDLELLQEKFECENLALSTLLRYNVRYHGKEDALLIPYYLSDGTLVSAKKITCITRNDSYNYEFSQEFITSSGNYHLFGWNQIPKGATSIILTASEFDAMAVSEATNEAVLALPTGISSFPIQCLPDLERFKKIILWFENDLLSWKAAKTFARKLNESRCSVIRPSNDNPGPYRALDRGQSLKTIMKKAHLLIHESIVGYPQLKNEVYSELANLNLVAGTEWKRFTALNTILKGHRRGELTVFTGPTGSGKTTFMSEYSLDLCESGVRTLWGSFEIPNVKLAKVMLTQFSRKNLSSHIDEFDHWSKQFENLPLYFLTFHGHQEIQSVLDAMTHAVYVHDIEHIIVDNLQFMMGSMNVDRFYVQDRIIGSFRNFATTMNCHVTVVIHPRKEKDEELYTESVFGSAKATQEADNIIILQDRRNTNPNVGKYIQVVKNRFDGDLGKMSLKFDKETYSFAKKEMKPVLAKKPFDYKDAVVMETENVSDSIHITHPRDSGQLPVSTSVNPSFAKKEMKSVLAKKTFDYQNYVAVETENREQVHISTPRDPEVRIFEFNSEYNELDLDRGDEEVYSDVDDEEVDLTEDEDHGERLKY